MKKNRAQRDILYLSISSFVLVVLWIGFNLYHAHVASTIEPDLQLKIVPIDPTFNTEIINKLKTREKIEPLYEYKSAQPSPTATAEPTAQITPAPTSASKNP